MEIEKRSFQVELRKEDSDVDKRTITGNATMFNVRTKIGYRDQFFYEEIDPRASDKTDFSKAKALFDHKSFVVLGSYNSGTLKIDINEKGLGYSIVLPKTRDDVAELVERNDINECSFAFIVREGGEILSKAEDGHALSRIMDIEAVYDVSLVPFPAYPGTSAKLVSARSARIDEFLKSSEKKETESSSFSNRNKNTLKLVEASMC